MSREDLSCVEWLSLFSTRVISVQFQCIVLFYADMLWFELGTFAIQIFQSTILLSLLIHAFMCCAI